MHVSAIMYILPGYRGTYHFGGYVLSGHCNQQQISVKTEGVLIFGGVLIYGLLKCEGRNEKCEFLARESVSSSPIVRIFGK